jgi:ATP-dependent DNA helicase RecQ
VSVTTPDPRAALAQLFGHDDFRPGQAAAVEAILAERDALVVMPTGAGKSLCYQLPALMRDDLTIVVSPLVSLMQDQVDGLRAVAPERVALVNAQRTPAENRATLARAAAAAGELRLLYVAPERFASRAFLDAVGRARLGLFVVDEAHCVSQWGHDFRPDYFRLADAARYLGARAIVALTATATPQVADDVVARLGLRDPARVTTGFDRPNLTFAVATCESAADKHRRIAEALSDPARRPAIVYAGTRNGCEELGRQLERALGVAVGVYHAGLDRARRAEVQRAFMGGEVEVVVATNAFGMGVDKADVRTVCHATVPQSVEAYYQEAGRAGRDGRPARALLLAEERDKGLHTFFIERAQVDEAAFGAVARRLARRAGDHGAYDLGIDELETVAGCDADGVRTVLELLRRAGVVQPTPSAPDRVVGRRIGPFDRAALKTCRDAAGEAQRVRWRHYRAIWAFVEQRGCRRAALLRHFGDPARPSTDPGVPCCDACDPAESAGTQPAWRRRGGGHRSARAAALDEAILTTVRAADPPVDRAHVVEILRGSRAGGSHDGLPTYGTFEDVRRDQVVERVDMLIARGALRARGREKRLAVAA